MRTLAILLTMLALIGCGQQTYQYDPLPAALERFDKVETMINAGDYKGAYLLLDRHSDLTGTGIVHNKARELVKKYPQFQQAIPALMVEQMGPLQSTRRAISFAKDIKQLKYLRVISDAASKTLLAEVSRQAQRGNEDGTLDFTLNDDTSVIPGMNTAQQQRIILERSLAKLKNEKPTHLTTAALMGFAEKAGEDSDERKLILSHLNQVNFPTDLLRKYVQPVYPDYANKLLAERLTRIRLTSKDRLMADDLMGKLENYPDEIMVVREAIPGELLIDVEKLQWDEHQDPERTQTISYQDYQVNLMAAVLLMPRNASYMYDLVSGGAELSYAIDVSISRNGTRVFNKLIRDRETRSYSFCRNARIQNVFGGVQAATFVANDHMQSQCSGNSSPVRARDLRERVIDGIAEQIREAIVEIKAAK